MSGTHPSTEKRFSWNRLKRTTDLFPTKIYKNYSGNLFGIAGASRRETVATLQRFKLLWHVWTVFSYMKKKKRYVYLDRSFVWIHWQVKVIVFFSDKKLARAIVNWHVPRRQSVICEQGIWSHSKKKSIKFYRTSAGLADMKDSLIKVKTALTVWCAQLFKENVLQSSVKFQLETIQHVYFAPVFSRMLKSRSLRRWRVPSL